MEMMHRPASEIYGVKSQKRKGKGVNWVKWVNDIGVANFRRKLVVRTYCYNNNIVPVGP